MQIEERDVRTVRPYEDNPRHNDAAVDAVARSIQANGWRVTVPPRADADPEAADEPAPDEERWAAVPGYEGLYEVSTHGRVRRASRSRMAPAGHILKPRLTWDGYVKYGLCKRRRYWHAKAHRLVALAFLGPPPTSNSHAAHYDGDKTNNHLANLRWASPAENEADKRRHGRRVGPRPGEQHPGAKLTCELVRRLRETATTGLSIAAVARKFGIPHLTAYDAVVGVTWKTVTEPPPLPRRRKGGGA